MKKGLQRLAGLLAVCVLLQDLHPAMHVTGVDTDVTDQVQIPIFLINFLYWTKQIYTLLL